MFIKLNLPIAGVEQGWDSPGKEVMDRRVKGFTFRPSGTLGFVSGYAPSFTVAVRREAAAAWLHVGDYVLD